MSYKIRTACTVAAMVLAFTACGPADTEGAVAEAEPIAEAPTPETLGSNEPLADEELDEQVGCVYPIQDDDSCIIVSSADGEITDVEPYSAGMGKELHLACAYQGHAGACDVLAFVGPGDGIGNWLTQTPTDVLVEDCDALTGVDRDLACAELDTRG